MGHAEIKRERLASMERMLERSKEGKSMEQVALELNVDTSTAHRYLAEIEQRREVIATDYGRYRLDPMHKLSTVDLYPDEVMVVYLALRRFIRQTGKATRFMVTAIEKVVATLQRADQRDMFAESIQSLRLERPISDDHTHHWWTLLRGWRDKQMVEIEYLKPSAEVPEVHIFEPYLFEPMPFGDGIYVVGWSHTRNGMRTFKPDRILEARLLDDKHTNPVKVSADVLFKHAWGVWYGYEPITVELIFAAEVASRLMETTYLPTEKKEFLPDGRLRWTAQVMGWLEILSWVRGWGPNVEVIQPIELREKIIDDFTRALEVYKGHTNL